MHVGGYIEHADMLETEVFERAVGGADIGTFHHGAAAAIDYYFRAGRSVGNKLFQLGDAFRLGSCSRIDRMEDVFVAIEDGERYRDYQWRRRSSKDLCERMRLNQVRSRPRVRLRLCRAKEGQEKCEKGERTAGHKV